MDYISNIRDRKYREDNNGTYLTQIFSKMYEMALRFLRSGSHMGDYSKELLEKPEKVYMGKRPKNFDQDSDYKLQFRFS